MLVKKDDFHKYLRPCEVRCGTNQKIAFIYLFIYYSIIIIILILLYYQDVPSVSSLPAGTKRGYLWRLSGRRMLYKWVLEKVSQTGSNQCFIRSFSQARTIMPDLVDFIAFRTDWKRKYFVLHQVIMKKLFIRTV